jgi:NTE family protein
VFSAASVIEVTGAGYRWSNLMPPAEGNSDRLFILETFSGGGTRASILALGVLRELASHQIAWEGKQKRMLDELGFCFS